MDNIPLLPENGPYRALWAHINRIVKNQKRMRARASSTVRVKETTAGTSHDVIVPPQEEQSGGEPIWL
jgi:hypothetical protein